MADLQLRSARWGTSTIELVRGGFGPWRIPAITLAIVLLTGFSFGGSLHNKPVAEDFIAPTEYAKLGDNHQFRPIFVFVMESVSMLAGSPADQPVAYHLASIGIHASVAVLLFALMRALTGSVSMATAVALIFALYPRHHETVLWPAGSVHALMLLWLLASVLAYLHAERTRRRWWFLVSVCFFGLGMLTSEDGAAGLGLFLAYELLWHTSAYRAPFPQVLKRLVARLGPFAAVVGAYGGLLLVGSTGLQRFVGTKSDISFYHLSFGLKTVKDFAGYLTYTVFPFVPLRDLSSVGMKAILMLAALTLLVGAFRYGTRLVRFGISWIVITVLPYALLVPFGNADRYFYLPAVGFCLLVAGLGQQWLMRVASLRSRQVVSIVLTSCLALYCVAAIFTLQARIQEWAVAGELVEDILDQTQQLYPSLSAQTTVYFVDLPDRYKQARVLGVGVTPAIQQRYKQALTVKASMDPELRTALLATPGGRRTGSGPIILLYRDGRLVDYSASSSDARIQNLLLTRTH